MIIIYPNPKTKEDVYIVIDNEKHIMTNTIPGEIFAGYKIYEYTPTSDGQHIYYFTIGDKQLYNKTQPSKTDEIHGHVNYLIVKDGEFEDDYLISAAKLGDLNAMYIIGTEEYLKLADKKDNGYAMYLLGLIDDPDTHWPIAAKKGYINALVQLVHKYENHKNIYNEIIKNNLIYAIKCGIKVDYYNLGNCCKYLNDIPNMKKYWLAAITKQDNVYAMYDLGMYYYSKGNSKSAHLYLQMGADRGHDKCSYMMGCYYYRIDKEIAAELWIQSGTSDALNKLYKYALYCRDVAKDGEKAKKYLKRFADTELELESTDIDAFDDHHSANYDLAIYYRDFEPDNKHLIIETFINGFSINDFNAFYELIKYVKYTLNDYILLEKLWDEHSEHIYSRKSDCDDEDNNIPVQHKKLINKIIKEINHYYTKIAHKPMPEPEF